MKTYILTTDFDFNSGSPLLMPNITANQKEVFTEPVIIAISVSGVCIVTFIPGTLIIASLFFFRSNQVKRIRGGWFKFVYASSAGYANTLLFNYQATDYKQSFNYFNGTLHSRIILIMSHKIHSVLTKIQ